MGIKFNKAEFARLIDRSPKHVTNLIKDGLPTEGGGGKGREVIIDSEAGIRFLIRREVAKQTGLEEGDESPAEGTKSDEDLKLTRAKRIQEEIKAKNAQGLSIEIEELKPVIFEVANIFSQGVDAIGGRLASELASEDDPAIIKSKLFEQGRDIRSRTSERLIDFISECYRNSVKNGASPATEDGG